ncbi:hypothetical protein ACVW1C_003822 [Bradyrhizobium sp. USDA 4011]
MHDIAGIFEESHINRVPIVSEGGDLVGIVTRANIIQAIAGARSQAERGRKPRRRRSLGLCPIGYRPASHQGCSRKQGRRDHRQ